MKKYNDKPWISVIGAGQCGIFNDQKELNILKGDFIDPKFIRNKTRDEAKRTITNELKGRGFNINTEDHNFPKGMNKTLRYKKFKFFGGLVNPLIKEND